MSIKIDLKIFLFAIIFWFTKQIEIYALLMILALIHECGHLVCGICLGLKLSSIKITPVGFQILFKNYIQDYNTKVRKGNEVCIKKIAIAFAGPLVNIFIAIISSEIAVLIKDFFSAFFFQANSHVNRTIFPASAHVVNFSKIKSFFHFFITS